MDSDTLALARELIRRPSVTPEDAGCQTMLMERLARLGFVAESLPFGEVSNCWLRRGDTAPLFVFAGHTDVVPAGPEGQWTSPPFEPTVRDGYLYGRGAADMKGSLAAFITALERRFAAGAEVRGSVGLLLTSDEEGPAVDGTRRVIEHLNARDVAIDYCLVGEPSSGSVIADTIRKGRRGSLSGWLTVRGRQGHVAYPALADNPVHRLAPALTALVAEHWDDGSDAFPATTFQISNFTAGTGADNVIPGRAVVHFNFRYSDAVTADSLRERVHRLLDEHGIDYELEWAHAATPYVTPEGELVAATRAAIHAVTGEKTTLSTGGGVSDGRFIAATGAQVIELGPANASIHQIDERVSVADLDTLSQIYEALIDELIGGERPGA